MPVRKALALFAFLALEGGSTRARLAAMFWSDLDAPTARRNLRHALHRLRAAGLGDALRADDEQVALVGVSHDLQAFAEAVAADRLDAARALRTGRLLEGLDLDDAAEFDDWVRSRREQFLRAWRAAMSRHAAALEGAGDRRTAIDIHQSLLDDDPLQEAAYRDLMRLHDALGERAAALELYARCEATLRDELQLEPLPETRLLAERIRTGPGTPPPAARRRGEDLRLPTVDLREVPLVGRERDLAAAVTCAEPVLLIEGEAGVGKSRFAIELVRRARSSTTDPDAVLLVRFGEMSSSTPFYAVADALRSAPARQRTGPLAGVWKRDLACLLPELEDDAPAGGAAPATPAEARTRLLEALAQALALAAGPASTVLFDDLQWADASSLELLTHLARRRRQAPHAMARVVATARSAELGDNPNAGIALQSIAGEGNLARLTLAAFDDWSMLQLVQRLSGGGGGVRFAARLQAATGGNVFFAIETLRSLFESGELRSDAGEGWSTRFDETTIDYAELRLPGSVVDAVSARLARLGAAARRVVETAALAEDGSTLAELQGATALSDWEALDGIERAVAGHVMDRADAGYRFVHDLFRVAVRSGLSPERQRLTHAKLAAALEPLQAAPARIAAHWQQAGQSELAVKAWIRAAEAALTVHARREAIAHYGRAAELVGDDARAIDLLDLQLRQMRLAQIVDGRSERLARLRELAARTGSRTLQFRALSRAADIAADERRMEAAERHALDALQQFEPPDADAHVHVLSIAAFAAGYLDRPEDSLELFLQGLSVAQRASPRAQAMMAASAARMAVNLDRLAQAAELRETALRASAAAPGTIHRAVALSQLSCVTRAQGDRAGAIVQIEEAVAIARAAQMPAYLAIFLANLSEVLVDDGRYDAARASQRECVAASPDPGLAYARYMDALTAAGVHELGGEIGAALAAARAGIGAADLLDTLPERRESRLLVAGLLLQIGADAPALALANEACRLLTHARRRRLLPAENLRAAAALAKDPLAAKERLVQALAEPFADRLLRPHVELAHLLLGQAELACGDADAARAAVGTPRYSIALEAGALAVRLGASALDGRTDPAALAAARALLDGTRVPPLHALALMKALASGPRGRSGTNPSAAGWRARMRVMAQALADSLRQELPLQAAFIRRHRDLLT